MVIDLVYFTWVFVQSINDFKGFCVAWIIEAKGYYSLPEAIEILNSNLGFTTYAIVGFPLGFMLCLRP